jgi:kynurenine formamidase
MKWKTFVTGYVLALALLLFAQRRPNTTATPVFSRVIDLTQTISEHSPNWEGSIPSPFQAKQVATIDKDGYFARAISLPEHFSTHIDAPAHFARGLWTVDQIPPERLIAPLAVIDVSEKVRSNPDYQLNVDDIAAWEQVNGQIPMGSAVFASTGWATRWPSMKDYRGADERGIMHFPGYSPQAAKFLVEGRNIVGLGIDTLSVDAGTATDFPVHHFTMGHSVYHVENATNLTKVPPTGAIVVVAPAKLQGGSGGPVRVLALVR